MPVPLSLAFLGGFLVLAWRDLESETALKTHARARPKDPADKRCPFCHVALAGAAIVACSRCSAEHHAECWSAHGKCSVYGCGSTLRNVALLPVAPEAAPSPAPVAPGASA